jgi:threonine aldolase
MDGARFSNAVASLGVAPKQLTWQAGIDVMTLGGTKNGLAIGEAVVFFNRELAREFDYRCKQAGQLASKMRFLSAPWIGMLQDGALLRHAAHANTMAKKLAAALLRFPGISIIHPVEANAVFVQLPEQLIERLHQDGWQFYTFIGTGHARLMCSWATTDQDIEQLVEALTRLG